MKFFFGFFCLFQKDKDSERQFRWLHCALTQQKLQEPIVMCGLGRLYSKQNVIEYLLEKDKIPDSAKHIKSLKDVKNLNLTPNPAYIDDEKAKGALDTRSAPYICKLIGLEMSGKFRFVALWSCGCVFSERALKEIKANVCALCQTPFTDEDIVILNGTDEEVELMRLKMECRITRRKLNKKKKSQEIEKVETAVPSTSAPASASAASNNSDSKNPDLEETKIGRISKNISNIMNKKRNLEDLEDPQLKKLKNDYSVAKDPKASNVYKSIFTSHQSEKEQSRAHWVTYNPFYN